MNALDNRTITFIGGGNMARSLVGGLIADGFPAGAIRVADPQAATRQHLEDAYGVATTADNAEAVAGADAIVLAVKPQRLPEVARDLAPALEGAAPLVVSVAAGIRTGDLDRWLGGDTALVRAMPNTPALVQCGATALYANPHCDAGQREFAESLLRAVGLVCWVEEEALMDAVTAVSGSGPAYFLLLMESMEEAGASLGLPRETARLLTLQTAMGAARMAMESDLEPHALRGQVTSPGGTTEQAVNALQEGDMGATVRRAMEAAAARAGALGDEFGSK